MRPSFALRFLPALLLLTSLFAFSLPAPTARADGNGTLGQSLARNQHGGYATAGAGFCAVSPCSGSGSITISSIPAGSTITDALVYWNMVSASSISSGLTGAVPVAATPGPRNPSAPSLITP